MEKVGVVGSALPQPVPGQASRLEQQRGVGGRRPPVRQVGRDRLVDEGADAAVAGLPGGVLLALTASATAPLDELAHPHREGAHQPQEQVGGFVHEPREGCAEHHGREHRDPRQRRAVGRLGRWAATQTGDHRWGVGAWAAGDGHAAAARVAMGDGTARRGAYRERRGSGVDLRARRAVDAVRGHERSLHGRAVARAEISHREAAAAESQRKVLARQQRVGHPEGGRGPATHRRGAGRQWEDAAGVRAVHDVQCKQAGGWVRLVAPRPCCHEKRTGDQGPAAQRGRGRYGCSA